MLGSQAHTTDTACFDNMFWRPLYDGNFPIYYQDCFSELGFHSQVHGHAAEWKLKIICLYRTRVKGNENKERIASVLRIAGP